MQPWLHALAMLTYKPVLLLQGKQLVSRGVRQEKPEARAMPFRTFIGILLLLVAEEHMLQAVVELK